MRRPEFFVLLFGSSAPPFVVTGVFFHQVALVEAKGWTLAWFAAWFPAWAGTGVLAALLTGWLVDRFDSRRLLPLYLLPLAAGMLVLGTSTSPYAAGVFLVLAALTSGAGGTLLGTLWPELFGTRHLGAIRSVAFASAVFASALAPGLIGLLLDADVALEHQFIAMAGYTLLSALCLTLLVPRLHRLVRA
jgi:MFS family permease